MIINPIPLLTAVGNGKGGGDYHPEYVAYDKVGSWAWDIIEIRNAEEVFDYKYNSFTQMWFKAQKKNYEEYKDITMETLFMKVIEYDN